ncbi:hypothetical protein CA984_04560 [Streptosporangium minutum]|uniref:Carrier domain-containing protein n=1 Tax=Streptosporangium minutum TaxID=569862 RepID=A0A243RWZ2_9ACTN|nr:hypothetical protein CA984_04560 [Streptosporangium minutum]
MDGLQRRLPPRTARPGRGRRPEPDPGPALQPHHDRPRRRGPRRGIPAGPAARHRRRAAGENRRPSGTASPRTRRGASVTDLFSPAPDAALERPEQEDPVITQVREIWQEILRIDDIGLEEDLYDLGGHSLTITQIIARTRRRLGVEVSLDVFFDNPTIAGLAEEVTRLRGELA